MQGLTKQLTALKEMSPAQLREKYLELFGEGDGFEWLPRAEGHCSRSI